VHAPSARRLAGHALALGAALAAATWPLDARGQEPPQDAAAAPAAAAAGDDEPAFTQEQLEQMLAPLALYPDDLLSQILMACTYPLDIVQADRWVKAHADLKGDEPAKALEQEDWDPSVKSLVAVPDLLALLSEKLDWTQQLGDAFLAQPKDVMDTVQSLRGRAKENGHLESDANQTVDVTQAGSSQTIVIESSDPEVIYVPVYETTVVYGTWPYPAYPPYPYYPPAWRTGAAIAIGFAWGYAWGHCDWHGGDVDVDINRNTNINRNIDRSKYRQPGSGLRDGQGAWKHDPQRRGSVPYRDTATAKRFDGVSSKQAAASREAFRGRGDSGSPRVIKGGSDSGAGGRTGADRGPTISDRSTSGSRTSGSRPSSKQAGTKSGALNGADRSGRQVRQESSRGSASRARSPSRSSASRGGGRGGGGRGGGGRGR
jgi:hypothetical protein